MRAWRSRRSPRAQRSIILSNPLFPFHFLFPITRDNFQVWCGWRLILRVLQERGVDPRTARVIRRYHQENGKIYGVHPCSPDDLSGIEGIQLVKMGYKFYLYTPGNVVSLVMSDRELILRISQLPAKVKGYPRVKYPLGDPLPDEIIIFHIDG